MNKKELYKQLEILQQLLSNEKIPFIFEAIKLFSPIVNNFKDNPKELLSETNNGRIIRQKINAQIVGIIQKEKNLKYRKIVVEASTLEDALKVVKSFMESEQNHYVKFITEIEEKLENFLTAYESHTRAYSVPTCLSLSILASELIIAIQSTNQILTTILVTTISEINENELCKLDLYLSNVKSLKDFAIKLDALADIYSELLSLYGESEYDYPILIEHLENGSLWIKVAGHTLTATLLTSVLTIATNYYHDNFTKTGQLNRLPVSVQVANDLLKISHELEKSGIDTTDIKENIESATRKIAKKLDVLLGDQPIVEINNNEYNIGKVLSEKLIEQSKTKRIENNIDS